MRLIRCVWLVVWLVVLSGCAAAQTPVLESGSMPDTVEAAQVTPSPTHPPMMITPVGPSPTPPVAQVALSSTPSLTLTATPATATSPPDEAAATFPLHLRSTWVYSATHYDTYDTERITATYRITETVVETQTQAALTAAKIERTTTLLTTSANLVDKEWQEFYLAGPGGSTTFWFVSNGNRLYLQDELDWAAIAADEATLEYIFPLSEGAMWYPDPTQRAEFPDFEIGPGLRAVSGPVEKQVPAGEFQNCYEVRTFYNGGSPISWFCPEVGVVESQFDHVGTPFGHRVVLEHYTLEPVTETEAALSTPLVELTASPQTAEVGAEITVHGRVSGIGLPHYTLYLETEPLLIVTYDNRVQMPPAPDAAVELVSATATGSEVTLILRARRPGALTFSLGATGEIGQASEQGTVWSWGGATSATTTVTIP